MIRHIVWWTLKEEACGKTAAENARFLTEESKMLHGLASARSVEVSYKIEPSTTVQAQLVLISAHTGKKELQVYQDDPVHLKFAALIKERCSSRNCIDCEVD